MPIVNEEQLRTAVLRYQATGAERDAELVLALADPIILGMLNRSLTAYGADHGAAHCRVQLKVWKAFRSYRPEKGRIFSFLNATVQNYGRTLSNEQLRVSPEISLEEIDPWQEPATNDWQSAWTLEHIRHKLLEVRTLCRRENELHAQRWLVRSLISSEFSLPRHEAVRALQIVFAVDLKSARLIHDRTMLELRRTLLEDHRALFPAINVAKLTDNRGRGLLKYRPFLSQTNFAKLVYLMRGLAPAIVDDSITKEVRNLNGNGTSERRREVIRTQLHYALEGYPEARPLFDG